MKKAIALLLALVMVFALCACGGGDKGTADNGEKVVKIGVFEPASGDSGAGARLGSFKGRVAGLGVTGAYNFLLFGKAPATLRLHAMKEFEARNRLEGESIFLDFSMPLWVNMPPGAGS